MIRSMTAFARVEHQENWGQICWELRSVNHRYLEIAVRLPDEWRNLELAVRKCVQNRLNRGKIDCTLYFKANYGEDTHFAVNVDLVQKLWEAIKTVDAVTGNTAFPDSLTLFRWPGVLDTQTLATEQVSQIVLQHLENALDQLIANREREGTQLAVLVEQRCTAIAAEVVQVRAELPVILQTQRERLQQRVTELTAVDNERLEQEIVLFAQRMDVAEELDRLEAHLIEMRQVLKKGQSVGRRLDFLVQELHREANTLGSKSNHIKTSRSSVELKVLIEQMREQIQNIE